MRDWLNHVDDWKNCGRCPLAMQRTRICLARGNVPCAVLFVGEAPGISEDAKGVPFYGPAGQLLDQIIDRSLPAGTPYAMTNLVACFPREAKSRGDNEPERGEILACRPRLVDFVNICRPRLIVRVGKLATTYCNFDAKVPFADIEHPASILRLPLVQQHMAARRAVVVINNAIEEVIKSPAQPWQDWGTNYAGIEENYSEPF